MLWTWILTVHHDTPHSGLRDPAHPAIHVSPNMMFDRFVAVGGHIDVPLDPFSVIGFLSAEQRDLQDDGLHIHSRTYVNDELLALRPSVQRGVAAAGRPLTVHFDDRPATDGRGIGRYTRALLAALQEEAERRGGEVHTSRRARGIDCHHSPWIDGAPLRPRRPTVVTLHDVVPLKRPGEYLRSGLRFRLRYLAVQRATRVIVPTQAVAEDAINELEIPAEKIAVIGEAPAATFRPRSDAEVASARERYELPDQYLLWVGGMQSPEPRKRVAALARAKRSMPLVLVGAHSQWAEELADVALSWRGF